MHLYPFLAYVLCDSVSITIWHLHGCSNACKCFFVLSCCFYVFAWVCMVFYGRIPVYQSWVCMLVYQMPNIRMSFKWVSTSNLMMFEWFFLILKYLQNCNPISSFTVLHHVPWSTFICSAAWCFHQFFMVFIYSLLSFLVMQQITNTVRLLKFQ